MAMVLPEISDEQLDALPPKRDAEVLVYRALRDGLPADVVVLYSVLTLVRAGILHEGEADFVVLDPRTGVLVLEVKGGGIGYSAKTGEWTSRDRDGAVHTIHDPFKQAEDRKHDLMPLVRSHPDWRRVVTRRTTFAHAAFFPHLDRTALAALRLPHTPVEIVGASDHLADIARWMEGVYRFSAHPADGPIGAAGVKAARDILRRDVVVDVPRAIRSASQEQHRIRLTEQQAAILDILADRGRVAVSGGAGTGKTVLAILEARRAAGGGGTPLLLCMNQLLGRTLADACEGTSARAMTLHQLYEWWVSAVSGAIKKNLLMEAERQYPGKSREKVVLPHAFSVALDLGTAPPFDTVILDEGQDLCDEDWLSVELLLEKTRARLVVFEDHNQALYQRASCFPITDPKDCFRLRRNCRNTTPIHDSAYRYYLGPPTAPSPIPGDAPRSTYAATRQAQASAIREIVQRALEQGESPEEIAVLIVARDAGKGSYYKALPPLAGGGGASWGLSQYRTAGRVIVESVGRFKGLEASTLVLWIGGDLDATVHREWIYVGMSRAKSSLYLVGTRAACDEALSGQVRGGG